MNWALISFHLYNYENVVFQNHSQFVFDRQVWYLTKMFQKFEKQMKATFN
jgi:hypothetical protein